MGCEVTVHNVLPTKDHATSADVMDNALRTIHESHPDLTPVSPAFKLKDTPSLCSIKLRGDVTSMDTQPRPDLLGPWIQLLRDYNPEWEVDWACAAPNKDKRLWIMLKGIEGRIEKPMVDVAKVEVQKLGLRCTGGFTMPFSSTVVLNMASLRDARALKDRKTVKIPKLGKNPLEIDQFPVVQPEWAFELIITGLDHYDSSMKFTLDEYFSRNYTSDGSTLWYRSRIVNESYYCFVMKDWTATAQVLQDKDRFETMCSLTTPNLGFPRLIYDVNTAGAWNDSIARKLKSAATSVSGNMNDFSSQINSLRREVERGFQHVDKRIDAQQQDFRMLTDTVSTLHDRVLGQSQALLAMQNSSLLLEQKHAIDMALLHKSLTYNMMTDDQKEVTRHQVGELEKQKEKLDEEVVKMRGLVRGITAPSLPPPPQLNAPPSTPVNTAPQASPASPPTRTSDVHVCAPAVGSAPTPASQTHLPLAPNTPAAPEARIPSASTQVVESPQRRQSTRSKKRKVDAGGLVTRSQDVIMDLADERVPDSQEEVCDLRALDIRENTDITLRQVKLEPMKTTKPLKMEPKDNRKGEENWWPSLENGLSTCRRDSHMLPIRQNLFITLMKNSTKMWLLIVVLFCLVGACAATTVGSSALSVYALNANGMVHAGKVSQIGSAIKMRRPHILVISETKTYDKVGKNLDAKDYNFMEETGVKMDNHHLYKWGIVVGIRKDIQIAQRLVLPTILKGRVVALDLVLGTNKGKGFLHRFIGTYAPWNPGAETGSSGFWQEMAKLCNGAAFSWSIAGDLNATVSNTERASGGTDARRQFLQFLQTTHGIDLWSELKPDRSRLQDWTCRAHNNRGLAGNIIDRVVVSANCAIEADIAIADKSYDYVQMTDHRAVIATIFMKTPDNLNAETNIPMDLLEALHQPRVKYPSKKDKAKFEEYQREVDKRVKNEGLKDYTVDGEQSFIRRYEALTCIIVNTATEVFGVTKRLEGEDMRVSSPLIRQLERRLRRIGGALYLERRGSNALVSDDSRLELEKLRQEFQWMIHGQEPTLRKFIMSKRKATYKELYHARMQEIISRAQTRDRRRMMTALHGGSTKRLVNAGEYIGLPTAVNSYSQPGEIMTEPEKVKSATCEYLNNLYCRSQPPEMEKPWMITPSVTEVKHRVESDPFQWPRKANLADFRAMLRKGNQRPAPGPDGWEKWCVKSLSDDVLQLVLDLHNYEVVNASFPGDIKDMTCTMFHKRNLRTDLANWRGIMLSNFLANSPMTWLTNLLTAYTSRMNIIPETQVATQQGVQTRDVISYLSSVKCFAQRNRQTIYALQRDQMKGFDYLAPQGFYDAIEAYGLPRTIADLDRAAQSHTKVYVRTAFGIAGPIVVNAVTKQGGPASPLKSTLTTSLGHRYLDDLAAKENGTLVMETGNVREQKEPHNPDHWTRAQITMVEATDDSIIFAKDLPTLQKFTFAMEKFQYAYGWLTSWKKTVAYGICVPDSEQSDSVQMPSITVERGGYNPEKITWHDVPLKLGEIQFLRTRVDDTLGRFEELQDFIKNFKFPKFSVRTPITLARKIVAQNIISRCRALLSLQPIKHADAEQLDRNIASKIHELLRFPYAPNTKVLTLPLNQQGLDFPSVARINAGIAVEGLMRDLNHHIKAYRDVANISYADWTCRFNGCGSPIDGKGLDKNFGHRYGLIPATWLVAHKVMGLVNPKLSLRRTDVSHITRGEVSLLHVLNICKTHGLQTLDGTAVNSLARMGITNLREMGEWRKNGIGQWRFEVRRDRPANGKRWTEAGKRSWRTAKQMLEKAHITWFFDGPEELLTPRLERQREAEEHIRVLADILEIHPSPNVENDKAWASDGSMIPAASGILNDKTVTSALTGSRTMVMKLSGRNVSILHGEIFGLIMGHLLPPSDEEIRHLYSDHLNTVRFLQDVHSNIEQESTLRYRNGRSYLRWLKTLTKNSRVQVEYTRGHSNGRSLQSKLNADADHFATSAQRHVKKVPIAPIPTFTMNEFTFYRQRDGWIESNIRSFMDQVLAHSTAAYLSEGHQYRMSTWLYHTPNPPSYIYHKAISAYTAAVQLYARSGQLATAERVEERQGDGNGGRCRLGCTEVENERHIFSECPHFKIWRQEAGQQLKNTVATRLTQIDLSNRTLEDILTKAKSFYCNDAKIWPLGDSQYYLGHVPKIREWIQGEELSRLTVERLVHGIYSDWHNTSVRLASRIFGELQRRVTRAWDEGRGNVKMGH